MRQDIQCIRAIAIISVIFFHLFPEYFPNGYLGVDIFFVISGYLMATILTKSPLTIQTISTFYYRRTKRILPVYLLVLLLIIISKQYLQTDVWWGINNLYAIFASVFLVNQKIIHDQADYFNSFKSDAKSANLFLHCWSLSVEVQFYCIVPFIFLGVQHLQKQSYKLLLLSSIFLGSYCIAFVSVDPNFTFNFTPARIWQFTAGMVVHILNSGKNNKEIEAADKNRSDFISNQLELVGFSTIFFVFLPIIIKSDVMRPTITIITAFVIYNEFGNKNEILSSRVLSYIGDISYILYLVHWPIYVYFRYSYDRLVILYLIFMVSILIHHSFETLILRQNIYIVSAVIAVLISLTVMVQVVLHNNPHFISRSYSSENEQLVRQNRDFMKDPWKWPKCEIGGQDYPTNLDFKFGHCEFEKGNGTRKVLIIGNSYTLNQADVIHQSFAGNYSTFEYLAIIANYGMFENHLDNSAENLEMSKRLATQVKPDVLFIITRFSPEQKQPITLDDYVLQQYNENLNFYERVAKKIYIMGTFPLFPINFLNFYIENLQMEFGRINIFRYSKQEVDEETRNAKNRLDQLDCKKCKVYDLGSVFLDDGYYYGYDKKTLLSYIDNEIHLTEHGLKAILPFYTNLTASINV